MQFLRLCERNILVHLLADQQLDLFERAVVAHYADQVVFLQYRMSRRDDNLRSVLDARNHGARHVAELKLGDTLANDLLVLYPKRGPVQLRELAPAFYFQLPGFGLDINPQQLGQQLDEQDHADHTERIGNTIGDGSR